MDSIKKYWIQQIQETKEFQGISDAEDPEIAELKVKIPTLLDEEFIKTSTEIGISRREKLLYITPKKSDSLEDRRLAVEARWGKRTPITYRKLENILDSMITAEAYDMTLFNDEYLLQVDLILENYKTVLEIRKMFRKLIPANLDLLAVMVTKLNEKLYTASAITTYTQLLLNGKLEREFETDLKFAKDITSYTEVLLNTSIAVQLRGNVNIAGTIVEREKEVIY